MAMSMFMLFYHSLVQSRFVKRNSVAAAAHLSAMMQPIYKCEIYQLETLECQQWFCLLCKTNGIFTHLQFIYRHDQSERVFLFLLPLGMFSMPSPLNNHHRRMFWRSTKILSEQKIADHRSSRLVTSTHTFFIINSPPMKPQPRNVERKLLCRLF